MWGWLNVAALLFLALPMACIVCYKVWWGVHDMWKNG